MKMNFYSGGSIVKRAAELYGQSPGPIWLDDVRCSGHEPDLNTCLHGFWGDHNCDHTEDVGCMCKETTTAGYTLPGKKGKNLCCHLSGLTVS